jgi:hypothetical protein
MFARDHLDEPRSKVDAQVPATTADVGDTALDGLGSEFAEFAAQTPHHR